MELKSTNTFGIEQILMMFRGTCTWFRVISFSNYTLRVQTDHLSNLNVPTQITNSNNIKHKAQRNLLLHFYRLNRRAFYMIALLTPTVCLFLNYIYDKNTFLLTNSTW